MLSSKNIVSSRLRRCGLFNEIHHSDNSRLVSSLLIYSAIVSAFLFTSWLIAVKQRIVSVTHAAWFTIASAWRVKHTSITTHHSTSCIQNSWRQSAHLSAMIHSPSSLRCHGEIPFGHILKHPSSSTQDSGYCSRNTLCRVLRGCSTIATVFSKSRWHYRICRHNTDTLCNHWTIYTSV